MDAVERCLLHRFFLLQASLYELSVAQVLKETVIALPLVIAEHSYIGLLAGVFLCHGRLLTGGEVVVDDVGAEPRLKVGLQHFAAVLSSFHVVKAPKYRLASDTQLGRLGLSTPLQGQ